MRERTTDDLCTPRIVIDALRPLGPITLDPCTNQWSTVSAKKKLDGSPGFCGLSANWRELAARGLVFVNPPYGRGQMPLWSRKATLEAARGCEIVMLVKGDHSTDWWRVLRADAKAIAYWNDRISFDGGPHGCGNFASALFYFGGRAKLFERSLAAHADIRVLR
ncbi:MAG TPA: DNA N-6-adenine-methyltransferase [Vulgatibacter sp.]|nr:DNA N-6-adenine-methyltransferase [Vulgatibacter sp.]